MIIKKAEKAKKSKESSKTPKGRVPEKKKTYFLLVFLQGPNPGKKKVKIKEQKIEFWNGTKCKICFTHL